MKLGQYLAAQRRTASISQKDLSEYFGWTTPQFISNVERDISAIPKRRLKKWVEKVKADPTLVYEMLHEKWQLEIKTLLGVK